mgnify:CR=1 FL=1
MPVPAGHLPLRVNQVWSISTPTHLINSFTFMRSRFYVVGCSIIWWVHIRCHTGEDEECYPIPRGQWLNVFQAFRSICQSSEFTNESYLPFFACCYSCSFCRSHSFISQTVNYQRDRVAISAPLVYRPSERPKFGNHVYTISEIADSFQFSTFFSDYKAEIEAIVKSTTWLVSIVLAICFFQVSWVSQLLSHLSTCEVENTGDLVFWTLRSHSSVPLPPTAKVVGYLSSAIYF